MRFVVTLVGPGKGALTDTMIGAARKTLFALGAEEISTDWLADGEAVDLSFKEVDPDQADAAVRHALGHAQIDCIAQPTEGRRKRLLVADMESTIIEQEMLDEIAELKGIKAEIAAITARAMNGEIDFVGALTERVALIAGLPESAIDALAARITLMPGADALVRTMRHHGARTILVSGGFTIFAEQVASQLGFDLVRANVLEFTGPPSARILAGTVAPPIRDRDDKLEQLRRQSARYHIPLAATLAVGDGANDIPMLLAAGLGVAFRAKPTVRATARAHVDHAGLEALLFAQGYRADEIVRA